MAKERLSKPLREIPKALHAIGGIASGVTRGLGREAKQLLVDIGNYPSDADEKKPTGDFVGGEFKK
ncbi:MAG: hypothetical protein HY424_01410 [Candidatus Levybacteria bacterium]|nr:hypothetical protein [Candidatus Levybacteria bacterium]